MPVKEIQDVLEKTYKDFAALAAIRATMLDDGEENRACVLEDVLDHLTDTIVLLKKYLEED